MTQVNGIEAIKAALPEGVSLLTIDGLLPRCEDGRIELRLFTGLLGEPGSKETVLHTQGGDSVSGLLGRVKAAAAALTESK